MPRVGSHRIIFKWIGLLPTGSSAGEWCRLVGWHLLRVLPVISANAPMSLTPEIPAQKRSPGSGLGQWLTFRA